MNKSKLIYCINIIFIFVLSHSLLAETIGNTSAVLEKGSYQLGAEYSLFFVDTTSTNKFQDGKLDTQGHNLSVRGAYGIFDWCDIYLKIGLQYIYDDDAEVIYSAEGYWLEPAVAYGIGTKFDFYEGDKLNVGTTLYASRYKSQRIEEVNDPGMEWEGRFDLTMTEYGIMVGASCKLGDFIIPYMGFKYYKINYDFKVASDPKGAGNVAPDYEVSGSLHNRYNFGVIFGLEIKLSQNVALGIEGSDTSISILMNRVF